MNLWYFVEFATYKRINKLDTHDTYI